MVINSISWIVDTGAFDHMTSHIELFSTHRQLNRPIHVSLHDGPIKIVTKSGNIILVDNIVLKDVLYALDFKRSLLSVSRIFEDTKLTACFTSMGSSYRTLLLKGKWLMDIKQVDYTVWIHLLWVPCLLIVSIILVQINLCFLHVTLVPLLTLPFGMLDWDILQCLRCLISIVLDMLIKQSSHVKHVF